jgi:hypothetical protein
VVKVRSSPSVTPLSLEATTRTWYVVPASRGAMAWLTATAALPLPALAVFVAVP